MRRALLMALAGVLTFAPAAHGQRAFTLGKGLQPNVTVTKDGTGHFVWFDERGANDRLRYCQVPRGENECRRSKSFPGLGDVTGAQFGTRTYVFTRAAGKEILLLAGWGPNSDGTGKRSYFSGDGGKTFEINEVGDESAGGPEDVALVGEFFYMVDSSATFTRGGILGAAFSNISAPLDELIDQILGSVSIASLGAGALVTADRSVFGAYVFRAAAPTSCEIPARCRDPDANLAPWSVSPLVPDHFSGVLTGGPKGIYIMWVRTAKAGRRCPCSFVFRRWNGEQFAGAFDEIAEKGASSGTDTHDLFQDDAGRLHAVWPRVNKGQRALDPTDLRYARSPGGTSDFGKPRSLVTDLTAGPRDLELETAPDGEGFLVWGESADPKRNRVRAVAVAPAPKK